MAHESWTWEASPKTEFQRRKLEKLYNLPAYGEKDVQISQTPQERDWSLQRGLKDISLFISLKFLYNLTKPLLLIILGGLILFLMNPPDTPQRVTEGGSERVIEVGGIRMEY